MPEFDFKWHDLIGLTGVVLLLLAYLQLQLGKIDSQGLAYSVMNLIAALLIIISLHYTFNLASYVIEIFWLIISLIGIIRYFQKRRTHGSSE